MHFALPYKTKQFFLALIKLSIVIGCIYFIYSKLTTNKDLTFTQFLQFLNENRVFSLKNICFLLLFTLFNMFFEILKWQTLLRTVRKISFTESAQQSLAGITASLITPNRIGDYGAKIAYHPKHERKKVALLNLIGHMSQMTVTTILGLIGLLFFLNTFQLEIDTYKVFRALLILIIIAVLSFFGLRNNQFEIKGYSLKKILDYILKLPKSHLSLNLIYAVLRYLIFSSQFAFILFLFGVELELFSFFVAITSMYFLASIIPALTLFDVVIKSSVAIYVFSFLGLDALTITVTTTLMWLLNFVFPSLLGGYFILNFKLPKSETL